MTTAPGKPRLDPAIFHLPVEKMRAGYYSDKYFTRAREILLADGARPQVTMQVFGKASAYLGGIDEAIAILKLCAIEWDDLAVWALHDGDPIEPWETVLLIEGPYDSFAHLETLYLGVLARRTRVGTNTRRVVDAARPKEVMFFPARHDHWIVQTGDGYAAHIAGAIGVSTDAQASWWGSEGVGTVPHALIAAYGGDTVLATVKFAEHIDPAVRLVTLVDFDNDCVGTSLQVVRTLFRKYLELVREGRHDEARKYKLAGVRPDTSSNLRDVSVPPLGDKRLDCGVNPRLVFLIREAIDNEWKSWDLHGQERRLAEEYCRDVKIAVTGGFNAAKIRHFEELRVPADIYGVGSWLLSSCDVCGTNNDFTADVVRVRIHGRWYDLAKDGRRAGENPQLERVG